MSLSIKKWNRLWIVICSSCLLTGCAPVPPHEPLNICKIYSQYPKWHWASQKTYQKWGVSPPVVMSIIFEESSYNAYAKPPRGKLLWIIPWKRPTTALGYAQATDGTWENYIKNTGHTGADRTHFADASDFIGWYAVHSETRLGISRNDAYQLYLAYHEGNGGYLHRSYKQKHWLMDVARKVQRIAHLYQRQLSQCEHSLPKKHWWNTL